jgi:hypothetical protein
MSIADSIANKASGVGVTLENNALTKLQDTLEGLAAQVTPEGQQLLETARAQLSALLTEGEQAGEALLDKGEADGKALIDHARAQLLSMEFYCGFREKTQ